MEMGSLDMQGQDVLIQGMEELPEVYRNMIHGRYIGKPVVQLWSDCLAPADAGF